MKGFIVSLLVLVFASSAFGQMPQPGQSPQVDMDEVYRRGDMVVRAGDGIRADGDQAFTDALGAPADDSGKWFITIIKDVNCVPCQKLERDLAESEHLKAWANIKDAKASWSHCSIYWANDPLQKFRWANIKVNGYPTVLLQPPRNRQFGDPSTVVAQVTGYTTPQALAKQLREAMSAYMKKTFQQQHYTRNERQSLGFSNAGGWRSPPQQSVGDALMTVLGLGSFVPAAGWGQQGTGQYQPPSAFPPYQPGPQPSLPMEIPPAPQPQQPYPYQPQPQVQPMVNPLSGVGGIGAWIGIGQFGALIALTVMAYARTYRKETKAPLLLNDSQYAQTEALLKLLSGKGNTPSAS